MAIAINEMKNIVHHLNLTTLNDVNMFQQLSSFIDQLLLSNNSSDKLLALQIQQKLYENHNFIDYQKKVKEDLALLKKENKTDEEKPKPVHKSTGGNAEVKKQEEKKNEQEEKKLYSLVYSQISNSNMTWFKALSFEQKVQALEKLSNKLDEISNLPFPMSEENEKIVKNTVTANNLTINELVELKRTHQISDEEYIRQKELIEKNEIYEKARELSLREGNLTFSQYIDICEASSKFLFYASEKYNLTFKIEINNAGKPQPVPDTVENRLSFAKMQQDFIQNDNTLTKSQKDYIQSEIASNLITQDIKNVSDKIMSNSLTKQQVNEEIYSLFNKFKESLPAGQELSPIVIRSFFNNIGANGADANINMGIRHATYAQIVDYQKGDKSALINNPLIQELAKNPQYLKALFVGFNFTHNVDIVNNIIKDVESNKTNPLPKDDLNEVYNHDLIRDKNLIQTEALHTLTKMLGIKGDLITIQLLIERKLTEEQIKNIKLLKEENPEFYSFLNKEYNLDQIISPSLKSNSKNNMETYLNDDEKNQHTLTSIRNELTSNFYKDASDREIEVAKKLNIQPPQNEFNNSTIILEEKNEEIIKNQLETQIHNQQS